jgi:hypothetical protein
VWLRSLDPDARNWTDLGALEGEHLPEFWKKSMDTARKAGHGGGDYFEVMDFVDSVLGRRECPVGIHEAMDMTLPGLVSQQSIAKGGAWMVVPDSREW